MYPTGNNDLPGLKAAREKIIDLITGWLNE